MEIMWEHIFDLVERMWELNQTGIANCLGVDKSTISRLKNGRQVHFNHPCDEVYRNLFDPTNPKSRAHGKPQKELLRDLKNEIKEAGWTDATKGLEDDDYKKFVIGLLKLVKGNQAKLVTRRESASDVADDMADDDVHEDTSSNTEVPVTLDEAALPDINNEQEPPVPAADHENESNDQEAIETETQPERMLDVCRQCFKDYPIKVLIDSNPADSIKSYLICDAFNVVKCIQQKHVDGDSPDKCSDVYQNIMRFADALLEYLKVLKRASDNINILHEGYNPKGDDNELVEVAIRYRQQLISLYQIINTEIEKDTHEYVEQQRAANKTIWDNCRLGFIKD